MPRAVDGRYDGHAQKARDVACVLLLKNTDRHASPIAAPPIRASAA